MTIDASLQIRKLPPSHITQLSIILEFSEQWKKLMAVIPSKLKNENFECCINCENPAKYNADHMRLIEAASLKYKKTGTEILLDEWGCSGRIRPSVGHLLYLLNKAELYRAADYVSEKILCRTSMKRPSLGPAAKISVNINGNIEEDLNNMSYSSSLINNLKFSSFNINLDYAPEASGIPEIVVTPDADAQIPNFQEEKSITNNVTVSLPNLNETNGQFPEEPYIPQFSSLLAKTPESIISNDKSTTILSNACSEDTLESNYNSTSSISNSENPNESYNSLIPNLSGLKQTENQDSFTKFCDTLLPNLSELNLSASQKSFVEDGNAVIPNLSDLNQSYGASEHSITFSNNIPTSSLLNQSSVNTEEKDNTNETKQLGTNRDNYLPDISGLIQTSEESYNSTSSDLQESAEIARINSTYLSKVENSTSLAECGTDHLMPNLNVLISESNKLSVGTFDSSKSRKCNSPLPNLTLTTHLPHYKYEQLKVSTNDFNEDTFEDFNKKGRLLGSGAFGKVFLGIGISQELVAVKKIILGNVEVVDIDDRVTKQFINEVEVLSKFRHKNLVSLLGFSCDGCTYCLLYEFISGGTLKDRLQSRDAKLTWQDRLSIALGTANAITYLHTAFSSPLIHRDVKTANILLDHWNKPKLGDFGITTLLDNQNMNTSTVIGTSAYMAPEAMRGDISVKCDTFSFGVVLLELLTSLPPFDETRDGHDLITHVVEKCEDSIAPLLDTTIGSWTMNDVNFAEEIFSITTQCIEEKKRRPVMVDVTEMLMIIISKL